MRSLKTIVVPPPLRPGRTSERDSRTRAGPFADGVTAPIAVNRVDWPAAATPENADVGGLDPGSDVDPELVEAE